MRTKPLQRLETGRAIERRCNGAADERDELAASFDRLVGAGLNLSKMSSAEGTQS
jgi:hypothetical protein